MRKVREILHGIFVGAIAMAFASPINAGQKEVQYAKAPSWVIPVPAPTKGRTPDGATFRMVYSDTQIHLGPDGLETFSAYRVKILRPEALAAGNLSVSWSPDAGEAKIHYVRIIRDKEVIDVLKSTTFQVLQREGFLERAALNGELTAVLQSPGLQVGDELEFAATVRQKDPTLGDHLFRFAYLPVVGLQGAFRVRIVWPKTRSLHWRVSADVTGTSLTTINGQTQLIYELRDPRSAVLADGAPARVNIRRFIEVSDFDSWSDVSQRIWPMFDKAAVIAPDSPIRKEISRIAAQETDPVKRMEAALRLVQEQIRYVYIGLNGGNYMPASADGTWDRRFGDCKAKTALLLAVLAELGIRGEAVLTNLRGGDGINERLPTPAVFDHVLVRVKLGTKTYWLDGTRLGDRTLDAPLSMRWVLPLRPGGSELEGIPANPPRFPNSILVMDVDTRAGFDQKATIKLQQVLRGDRALDARARLMAMSAEDADRAVRAYWRQTESWIVPDAASWRFDDQRGTLLLTLAGQGKIDWTGDDAEGRSLDIFGAGFTPPAEFHRPAEQDHTAPWITEYPAYNCWATAIHLPTADSKWKWDYFSDPMDTHMGGIHYWRVADLRNGVMRTIMSKRSEVPEITAQQAEQVNKQLPAFNNNKSRVYQIESKLNGSIRTRPELAPFQDDTDWTSPNAPCGSVPREINTPPQFVAGSCTRPPYPSESFNSGESGTVQLRFVVNGAGEIVESKMMQSSGHERLDAAARAALEHCKFEPATRDGAPRSAPVLLEYVWSLTGPSGVRQPPIILPESCEKPKYPQDSRRMNEQGNVLLRFFIDEAGTVLKREVERSSGYERLDEAAASGLSLCKFTPATFEDKPTSAWARLEYVFRLQ